MEQQVLTDFRCILCNTCFLTKSKYDYHSIFCKWRHTPPKTRELDYDNYEKILTDHQRDKLLRDLLYQVQQMNGEIKELKKKVSNLTKKEKTNILKWLNQSKAHIPTLTFQQWIDSIPIHFSHLEKVFHTDLIQGMCECIKNMIDSSKNQILPFYAFIQNGKHIYIYRENRLESLTTIWVILDKEECKKMINRLASRFFKIFVQWQFENQHLNENPEWQEKEMIYSRKFIGQDTCENTRYQRFYDWFYSYIQQNWTEPLDF
jgi:hypothetical protein